MQAPYLLMTSLYLLLTALVTLDSALASLGWTAAFTGIKWMRVHFITLGVLTQMVFSLLPSLTAKGLNLPKPKLNWPVWMLYNAGLVVLLIGLPFVDRTMIITGGTLIFIAVLILMRDLIALRRAAIARSGRQVCSTYSTTRFYLAGLAYLLVGVLVGTGMWIGWAEPLHIAIPKEVHVHTNLWGYTALIFAGVIYDLFPALTRRKLRGIRLDMLVFGSMALGALGLVVGPWLDQGWPAVAGLSLHTLGTLVLLIELGRMAIRERRLNPGTAHLLTSYIWILLPVVIAPFIVTKAMERFPVDQVAGNGGPILIYGWILTFSLAVIPYFFAQIFQPNRGGNLGGSWLSLASIHLGSLLFWIALFLPQTWLRAGAYLFWLLALLPILRGLSTQVHTGAESMEHASQRIHPGETVQTE